MRIAVGSTNPVKIRAVKSVFSEFFGDAEVVPRKVDSGVSRQPKNYEVISGAINRARRAYSSDVDYSVGIEAGLLEFPHTLTGYLDFQFCGIYDGENIFIGAGPGFEYPPRVVREVDRGKEVGEVMEQISGISEIGRKHGSIGFLTKNRLSREDITKIAVTMAVIPLINEEIYRE